MNNNKNIITVFKSGIGFIARQQRNWKVTALRSSIYRFFYQMTLPYLSIYIIALGASKTQLGMVNSIGLGIAGLISPLTGWLLDRLGVKRIYLLGIGLLIACYLIYGLAQNWIIVIFAMLSYWLGFTISQHSCVVICGNALAKEDRATAMSCCESLAAGVLGMIGPILGAFVVTSFGGTTLEGIRPLFYIALAGTIGTFILIWVMLKDKRWVSSNASRLTFFKDIKQVFQSSKNLKRWLVISSVGFLPYGMLIPFTQVFASEVKGADQFTLGAMVTGFALIPFLLGVPAGKLADKIGRKKVLYITGPLYWASSFLLLWAPNQFFLIAAGALQGFISINLVITGAMTFELVPKEHMGRWTGIVRLARNLLAAGAAFAAGLIWDGLGPQFLFIIIIAIDALVRIPLLIGMPETLTSNKQSST